MKKLFALSLTSLLSIAVFIPSVFAEPLKESTLPLENKTVTHVTGYTVDKNFSNLGANEGTVEVSIESDKTATIEAIFYHAGKTYQLSGEAKESTGFDSPLYSGMSYIETDNEKTPVYYAFNPNVEAINVVFQDQSLQFVDGRNSPSYKEGYSKYLELQPNKEGSLSSKTPSSINSTASVDPYIRGNGFGTDGKTNVYMEVIGPQKLARGKQNIYSIRAWLASDVPKAGYGTNLTGVKFAGNTGDSDVYAQQLFPEAAGNSSSIDVSYSVAYQAFSVSVGYTAASPITSLNYGTSWSLNQSGTWSTATNRYQGSTTGNGLVMRAAIYASSGSSHSGSKTGTAKADLQLTNYGGLGSIMSYWINNNCSWNYNLT